jgi:hypothetical protein
LQRKVASGELPATVGSAFARIEDDKTRRDLADQYACGVLNRAGVVAAVNDVLKKGKSKPARMAVKLGGLSVSVCGQPKKLSYDTLIGVLERICREAQALKSKGRSDLTELVQVLKAS